MQVIDPDTSLEKILEMGSFYDKNGHLLPGGDRSLDAVSQHWVKSYDDTMGTYGSFIDTYLTSHGYDKPSTPINELNGISKGLPDKVAAVTVTGGLYDEKDNALSKSMNDLAEKRYLTMVAGSFDSYLKNPEVVNKYTMLHEELHKKWGLNEEDTYSHLANIFDEMLREIDNKSNKRSYNNEEIREIMDLSMIAKNALQQYTKDPYQEQTLAAVMDIVSNNLYGLPGEKEKQDNKKDQRSNMLYPLFGSKTRNSEYGNKILNGGKHLKMQYQPNRKTA